MEKSCPECFRYFSGDECPHCAKKVKYLKRNSFRYKFAKIKRKIKEKLNNILYHIDSTIAQKEFWIIAACIFFYCVIRLAGYEDAQTEYLPQIEDLEYKIEKLENENSELKSKLATINQLASGRHYNYNDLLDDIEYESSY